MKIPALAPSAAITPNSSRTGRTTRGFVGSPNLPPALRRGAPGRQRPRGLAARQLDGADGSSSRGPQRRCSEALGHAVQLGGGHSPRGDRWMLRINDLVQEDDPELRGWALESVHQHAVDIAWFLTPGTRRTDAG
jgi:hypothetical protein